MLHFHGGADGPRQAVVPPRGTRAPGGPPAPTRAPVDVGIRQPGEREEVRHVYRRTGRIPGDGRGADGGPAGHIGFAGSGHADTGRKI